MKLNHLIESQQLDLETITSLFLKADHLRKHDEKPLQGKILATLFYEPSTRTRLSFESAMIKLGGNVISTENAREFSSAIKGESIEDTARIVSAYADGIVMRHYEDGAAKRAASVSPVPVINAGDGKGQHPTQALLDLYTIQRELGRINCINVAMVGDLKYGRTIRSLCYLLGKFQDIKITFISPKSLAVGDDIKQYLEKKNILIDEQTDLDKNLPYTDILYMTRIQKERMSESEYKNSVGKYVINENNIFLLKDTSRLLHPLPHVEEIVLGLETEQTNPRVAYFRQAENGLYIRMALLWNMLG